MNIGIICNTITNNICGIICHDAISGDIAYTTNNEQLSEFIDIILDNNLQLPYIEQVKNVMATKIKNIYSNDAYYLIAINYYLPSPWRILTVKDIDGDMEIIIKEFELFLNGEENYEKIN